MCADERHGHDRDLGADGHKGGAVQEIAGMAGLGPSAFGEDEERHARLERFDGAAEARDGRARGVDVYGYLSGTAKMPADKRQLPQIMPRHDAKLKGQ